MTDIQEMTGTTFVGLNKLDADPKNVRKTYSREGVEKLAATIRADRYRLLQNIIVRKGDKRGRFFVAASGSRLAALTLLADAGEMATDYPVECKERNGADATEISLIENTSREAMHLVDEYEAFRTVADKVKSVEDIAARIGTIEVTVRIRLALGRISPALLARYRDKDMSFQQLAHNPEVALAAVVYAMLISLFHPHGSTEESCLEIKLTSENSKQASRTPQVAKASKRWFR